ncbi:SH3 domain-containing protein [Porphyromonas macacae]|uniref:SH3 domain-containing protein n=1 Tax=Porphyromonas macacae TaxID=28115 RepID=UPI00351EAD15
MEREVAVRSTPDQSGTLLFNLHEGTKVKITGTPISGWYPISVGADKEGWLAKNTVERILKNSNKTND